MFTRSPVTSVLPGRSALLFAIWRRGGLWLRITVARERSLRVQDRAEEVRSRCIERHLHRQS